MSFAVATGKRHKIKSYHRGSKKYYRTLPIQKENTKDNENNDKNDIITNCTILLEYDWDSHDWKFIQQFNMSTFINSLIIKVTNRDFRDE